MSDNWFLRHKGWSVIISLLIVFSIAVYFLPYNVEQTDLTGKVVDESIQNASEQAEIQEQNNCFDSDGGKDYYTKGYINLEIEKFDDECVGSNTNRLIEQTCEGVEFYECLYGCSDGKCNSKPEEDSQIDNQQMKDNEQTQEQQNKEEKKCNWGYSDEYKCDGNTIRRKWVNSDCSFDWFYSKYCSYGCENGDCKKVCQAGYTNEYECSGQNLQRKYYYPNCSFTWIQEVYCTWGCENAECKSCYDSDGGKNYYVKGYIPYPNGSRKYDECGSGAYKDYVAEYYCTNDGFGLIDYKCDYGCLDGRCNPEPQTKAITVSYVFDGDTVQLSSGEKVRLIGINAPESTEPCYLESKSKLTELTLNKNIILEQDVEDKDQYGRLLRYIYVNNLFVNLEMVRLGLAHKYEYGKNTKYSAQFEQAEKEAKASNGCLWKSEEINYIQDKCIYIINFHFDATGNDNYNLNDEYVTFGNKCSYSIDMTKWTVKDETASHIYTFPQFTFKAGVTFTLYTGVGTNTASALYWGRASGNYAAIWNNNGDTLFLRDSKGNLVLTQSYTGY